VTRRVRLLGLAGLLVLVAGAAVLVFGRPDGDGAEPLDAGSVGDLTQALEGGATFADADVVLYNRADSPLTLESVRVIADGPDVPASFRFLVAGPDRTDDIQGGADLQCPPSFFKPKSMGPVRGFTLQPRSTATGGEGAVLITCFKAPAESGRFRITGLRITYRHDGDRRTVTISRNLAVCVAPDARCEPVGEPVT
jgi:hypothetical protein